jgi:hypothetical protein
MVPLIGPKVHDAGFVRGDGLEPHDLGGESHGFR